MRLIGIIIIAFLCSCTSDLDVSLINPNSSVKGYELNSYPSIKSIVIDVTLPDLSPLNNYYTKDNILSSEVHFSGIPIDSSWGLNIFTNKDKLVDLKFYAKEESVLDFADVLYKKLGNPTEIFNDSQTTKDSLIYYKFRKQFPKDTKWIDNQNKKGEFSYPYVIIWNKPNMVHVLSLSIDNSGEVRNKYTIISKEAYRNKIFYAYGLYKNIPKNSPLYNYLK